MMSKDATPVAESVELLPCPFCGGQARLSSVSFPMVADVADIQVSCSQCDSIGPSVMYEYGVHTESDLPDLEGEATAAWNSRHRLASYEAGRAEGVRAAAEVAESEMVDAEATGEAEDTAYNTACRHIATAIRALSKELTK